VLGFVVFGRSCLGPFLLVAAGLLLTLLRATNAYLVLGFVFTLLILMAQGINPRRKRSHPTSYGLVIRDRSGQ
jgi:hypothetical protein